MKDMPPGSVTQDQCHLLHSKLGLEKAVFIWGDSHAQHLNYGLTQNLPLSWQVLQVAVSGCGPLRVDDTEDPARNYCSRSNSFALKAIKGF